MKLYQKISLSLALVAVAGIIVFIATRKADKNRMLSRIADEGYETAQDVLYPGKELGNKRLHYGPVIPGLS